MHTCETLYFEQAGPVNTDATLGAAKRRAEQLGIDTIIVASTRGNVGVLAADYFAGKRVIVVTHTYGFKGPNTQQLTEENRERILSLGATIHTATHGFGGVGRAVNMKFNTIQTDEIIANTLRLMGQGFKVAIEITAMAADAGLVRTDREVIAIAGSSEGADTAIVVQPSNVHTLFDLKVKEVICKPR